MQYYLNPQFEESIIAKVFDEETLNFFEKVATSAVADNAVKQGGITEKLESLGFSKFGAGTNRLCAFNDKYPDYAFKIAIDRRGIADNLSDAELYQDQELVPYITELYETNGIVEVSEKVIGIRTKAEIKERLPEVGEILKKLINTYLLDDIWVTSFMNWGYSTKRNKMVILDYAYMCRKDKLYLKCTRKDSDGTRCGGDLTYTRNMLEMVCPVCGRHYSFGELKATANKSYTENGDESIGFIGSMETL